MQQKFNNNLNILNFNIFELEYFPIVWGVKYALSQRSVLWCNKLTVTSKILYFTIRKHIINKNKICANLIHLNEQL